MSHGIGGIGNGHGLALGHQQQAERKSGEHAAVGAQQPAGPGGPAGLEGALAALTEVIKNLAASLHVDSFNGAPPPAGMAPANTGATNPGNLNEDSFLKSGGAAAAPLPAATADVLDLKGGGGAAGGVVGSRTYLAGLGGGGAAGGVVGSKNLA